MKLEEFNYHLPKNLIAQYPVNKRDRSKLLVLSRKNGKITHHTFYELVDFFKKGDVLVLNNSKVFPARLFGKKTGSLGKAEIFLHKKIDKNIWQIIGKKLKVGQTISIDNSSLEAEILTKQEEIYTAKFNIDGEDFYEELEKAGRIPLPPYIKRNNDKNQKLDKERYQTIFAKERGSVAAPTAGLHFTEELISQLIAKGVRIVEVTLHVGLGTFAPVKVDDIKHHKMHEEYFCLPRESYNEIVKAKKEGNRVIAVGTTSTRVLETIFGASNAPKGSSDISGSTDIFIYPGYKFKCIDGLVTNFHLPKSTLLMLVSAFAGREEVLAAYSEAIDKKYRFFSYGDAMLII